MKNVIVGGISKGSSIVGKFNPAKMPVSEALQIFEAWKDYKTTQEIERTKRSEIENSANIQITKIKEASEIIRSHLMMSHNQRKENFEKMLNQIDVAIEKGDHTALQLCATTFIQYSQQNPLQEVAELFSDLKSGKTIEF